MTYQEAQAYLGYCVEEGYNLPDGWESWEIGKQIELAKELSEKGDFITNTWEEQE